MGGLHPGVKAQLGAQHPPLDQVGGVAAVERSEGIFGRGTEADLRGRVDDEELHGGRPNACGQRSVDHESHCEEAHEGG